MDKIDQMIQEAHDNLSDLTRSCASQRKINAATERLKDLRAIKMWLESVDPSLERMKVLLSEVDSKASRIRLFIESKYSNHQNINAALMKEGYPKLMMQKEVLEYAISAKEEETVR